MNTLIIAPGLSRLLKEVLDALDVAPPKDTDREESCLELRASHAAMAIRMVLAGQADPGFAAETLAAHVADLNADGGVRRMLDAITRQEPTWKLWRKNGSDDFGAELIIEGTEETVTVAADFFPTSIVIESPGGLEWTWKS